MGAALPAMRLRLQPQQAPQVDWGNPITRGLVFAYVAGSGTANGWGANGVVSCVYTSTQGVQTGTSVVTPMGQAVRTTLSTDAAFRVGLVPAFQTANYSLFAAGTGTTTGTQNAIDDDDSATRKFQFRLASGNTMQFIPFTTSGAIATPGNAVIVPPAMNAADAARGFTMGATASPLRAAAFLNRNMTAVNVSGTLAAPGTSPAIGNRRNLGNAPWTNGGLSLVAMWSRTLSDSEMLSLADNPWQLFKAPSNGGLIAALAGIPIAAPVSVSGALVWAEADDTGAAAGTATDRATLAWTEADDSHSIAARTTDRATPAWTEADDGHSTAVRVTDRATLAWTEADDISTAALRVANGAVASWIEADDVTQIAAATAAPATNVSAAAAWTEADDTSALAAALRDRTLVAWAEADDTMAAALALRDAGALAWAEAADTMAVGATARAAAALAWAEANDIMVAALVAAGSTAAALTWTDEADVAHLALRVGAGITIDAALVPASRIVVFEGSRRVVLFEGGKRMVEFK